MGRSFNIVVLAGDGIGPEVTSAAVAVLKEVAKHTPDHKFNIENHLFGGCAIDAEGIPLPDKTLEACRNADAILLGAVGGPKWGVGKVRPEQGLLLLRKSLNLYANIRPALFPSESLLPLSPLKPEIARGTNIIVVRELIGGIYFGNRTEAAEGAELGEGAGDDEASIARDESSYSVAEIRRITRLAAALSLVAKNDPKGDGKPLKIWSVDKANVLATSRLWRKTVTHVLKTEFPEIEFDHQLVDSAAMLICSKPKGLNGVILTENLFGDILSDETSVIPGSLGLLPSASLSGLPDASAGPDSDARCLGLYEPIHGSAPDIAGKGIANPIGTILSLGMLLRYSLNLEIEAKAVEEAVRKVLDDKESGGLGLRTADLGGKASTSEVGEAVAKIVAETLGKA